jgi:catechol 2,3-dioxygenase-like lactoylglutathione lyase family enzyme
MKSPVLELRVAITTDDFERLTRFYQEGLGLEPAEVFGNAKEKGLIYEMGNATLEVFNEPYAASVDAIEVGRRVSGHIRLAIRVPDLAAAVDRLVKLGVTLVHEPIVTPWGHHNARLQSPDGLQITLFQILDQE